MQGVSEGDNPPPRQIPACLHGSFVLYRGTLLSLKKGGTSERVPSALPAPFPPVLLQVGTGKDVLGMQKLLPTIYWAKPQGKRWCSLCSGCVYPTCQWTIKTGHWKINLNASKSPQESIFNGIIFFLLLSDPFFLLLKLTSFSSCWTSISWQQTIVRNFPSSPEVDVNIWCLCMLMKRG